MVQASARLALLFPCKTVKVASILIKKNIFIETNGSNLDSHFMCRPNILSGPKITARLAQLNNDHLIDLNQVVLCKFEHCAAISGAARNLRAFSSADNDFN